jgi:eukaryotic-like serine/threonine-protein kinase
MSHEPPTKARGLIGQQIGNYRLVSLLGSGGFAEVYLGRHVHRQYLQAAIKILHTKPGRIYQKWFLQAAETIASLKHPHIIRIIDFGIERAGNTPYLIMDYAPGGTLRARHPKGSIVPLPTVASYVQQGAQALQHAHDRKLIHRDLKPENLLVGKNGEIILSDFGIAAIAHSSTSMDTGISVGTVPYSAPEQIQGKPRRESDQYALGIIVYEWLTGKTPFTGDVQAIIRQHLGVEPVPLREKASGIPPEVETVVMRALAKEPQQRFGSIEEFATAFEQACHLPAPLASSSKGRSGFLPALIASPRNMLLVALVLLIVLLSVVGGVGVYTTNINLVATATATTQMTATATARNATLTAPTATTQVNATATTQANATATTQAAHATATATTNPYGGTLVLSESLSDISHGYGWPVIHDQFGTCQFRGGAYHVSTTISGSRHWCDASPVFSNFAFEVQMTILKGDTGGITFRAEDALNTTYVFSVGQNGRCELYIAQGTSNTRTLVQPVLSLAVHQGLGKTNTIAVVAQGNTITLHVNHQQIASVTDSTSSHGLIGLVVSSHAPGGYLTEVAYSNARVWTF